MKISPNWLREYVDIKVDDRKLAEDLTLAGIAVEGISSEGGETVFEMEITTNRPDAMNHYGIAREASAIYDVPLKLIEAKIPAGNGKTNVTVEIKEPQLCARFTGQVIRNAKIGASSEKVLKKFRLLEQKPINNAADATNYVMLEMGKPTHAFDLDKLAGQKIIVRLAKPGEALKTLDGVERKLHPEDLVIADAEKAVAIAGVIGGWDTMITESTKNVLIESAWFDPATIRKTSKRHLIHTDASHRFERGADWASTPLSCALVAQHILEHGGELEGEQIDVIARKVEPPPCILRLSEVKRILGKDIPAKDVEHVLTHLGFVVKKKSEGAYDVVIPTWRLDVEREIDLVEEIARIHGYNQFPNTLPAFHGGLVELDYQPKFDKLRSTLLALGYNEALSNTFIAKEDSQKFSSNQPVAIANPLSEEASSMRTSLLPGMLQMLAYNLNRGTEEVRLFESGHIYTMEGAATDERPSMSVGATGAIISSGDATEVFRRFKGDIESLLEPFAQNAGALYFDPQSGEYFHPGCSARAVLNGATVAKFGQVSPEIAAARKIKQPVYVAEIALDRLYQNQLRVPRYQKLSRFPAIDRDFSFLFDEPVTFASIEQAVRGLKIAELQSVAPQEIFRGGKLPAGKYSLLVRTVFQSAERTLRDEEVAEWSAKIVDALTKLGGQQR